MNKGWGKENQKTVELWLKEVERALKGKNVASIETLTYEGIKLKPLYTKADCRHKNFSFGKKTGHDWTVCQKIQFYSSAEDLNNQILNRLENGLTTIYLEDFSFVKSGEELGKAFKSIDLTQIHFFFDFSHHVEKLSIFRQFLKEKVSDLSALKGVIAFDPLEKLMLRGNGAGFYDELAEHLQWIEKESPSLKGIFTKGDLYNRSGSSSVQEIAYTFSSWLEVLDHLSSRGFSYLYLAKQTVFSFSIGSEFFTEIAKLRAAKQIWATIIEGFEGHEELDDPYIHCNTAVLNKTLSDVHVNLLRTTTEAFSAALAGITSLNIGPYGEICGKFDQKAERLARNTHYILKEESYLTKVTDPVAGSYYVENLTNELAEKAWNKIGFIEDKGGFLETLKCGKIQVEINAMASTRIGDINTRVKGMVGTTIFANLEDDIQECKGFQFKKMINQKPNFIAPIKPLRLAEHFEQLRINALSYKKKKGHLPKVGVIVLGRLKDYKHRLDFIQGILSAGGFETVAAIENDLEIIKGFPLVLLCGQDRAYEELDEKSITQVKNSLQVKEIMIVGAPPRHLREWKSITNKMNVYQFLQVVSELLEVSE
ncbi:methylmalonyl-CoA mutase family protein [Metabacillus arenae]|uniref:Methylmalonyl-CoA mutase alpha/beta chain catalytic domain-containing protein n=1 Tax=Metabacillus arenae TaxID=2771434 RepID=A0A926RZ72_9BACI|nr:methylmalonyl-CoA mutase family protein [Metabacillus arenae]MBD1378769.1 hypothetical protein [Metabacillus arenae]